MSLQNFLTSNAEQEQLKQLILDGQVAEKDVYFCTSLVQSRSPSAKQMYWVGKMIEQATGTVQPVVTRAAQSINPVWIPPPLIKVDMTKVNAMFSNARQHLKFPKVTLLMDISDFKSTVRFSVDRRGRNCIWMNDAVSYGVTYGNINVDTGVVTLKSYGEQIKDKLLALVDAWTADPIRLAIMHGKLTGNCCFCRLPLSDERSLQCGYGDTCAKHYHLPWGRMNEMTAMGDWVMNGVKVA